jgi:hypothetical protein
VTGVFVYLTVCTIRNTAWRALRRLRQPRYLLIAAGFVLWIGSTIVGRPSSGSFGAVPLDTTRARAVAVGVATLLLASGWMLPVGAPLRFTNAEIQFLFPAPATRRQLIAYKLVRILLGAAVAGAFLAVFVGPTRPIPALFFAAKSALIMMVLTVHGVGIATYRSRASDAGPRPGRRWPIVAAVACLTPFAGAALVVVAFSSAMRFVAALPIAAVVIGVHVAWVLRTDSAFEDAATEAAEKMNRAVATGHAFAPRLPRRRASSFRLAPGGPAETAILWKNWLLLGRRSRQALLTAAILLVSVATIVMVASGAAPKADVIGGTVMFAVMLTVLLGPAMLRIDLRQDLTHLALIKTWPIRGAALIRGELLAPAIALSLAAAAAIAIGSAVAPGLLLTEETGAGGRATFAAAAVLATTAVITAQLVVHNGFAVCFPAWVELKVATGAAALEMNVRMILVMYGSMLALAVLLVLPAAAGFLVYAVTGGLLISSAIFAAVLACESVAAIEILGRILDRTDLHDVVVAE